MIRCPHERCEAERRVRRLDAPCRRRHTPKKNLKKSLTGFAKPLKWRRPRKFKRRSLVSPNRETRSHHHFDCRVTTNAIAAQRVREGTLKTRPYNVRYWGDAMIDKFKSYFTKLALLSNTELDQSAEELVLIENTMIPLVPFPQVFGNKRQRRKSEQCMGRKFLHNSSSSSRIVRNSYAMLYR